jgi:hypothetical protein
MKLKEILKESPTDVVARFYKEASKASDKFYNPENVQYKDQNAEYYTDHFKAWVDEGVIPVFTKPAANKQTVYNNVPLESKLQSPGYRGLQYALASAGLPYNHNVQKYEVNPAKIVATQTMDAARNNNGQ